VPRNIEIKARAAALELIEARARAIADAGPFELEQDDTFFTCRNGRLKLRILGAEHGELIFYQRPDEPGPKLSQYTRVATATPQALREALAQALGIVGRVRKHRTVYLAGATRIHLDRVEGLGPFVELEVTLAESQSSAEGVRIAQHLLEQLGVDAASLISQAYVDLLRDAAPA
jgi:adenylate cyclase